MLTYPKIVRHSHYPLKLERDVDGQVLVKARLHGTPTGQWRKIVLPLYSKKNTSKNAPTTQRRRCSKESMRCA